MKVLTITPNPALDLSGEVTEVIPNEKNYVRSESRHPGGNAINVARVLTRLKVSAVATGFLGGSTGQEVKSLLRLQKVPARFIPIRGNTRINVTVQSIKTHDQTRLSFAGPRIFPIEKRAMEKMLSRLKAGIWVLGGSLPEGLSNEDLVKWVRLANRKGIPFVLDVPGKILAQVKKEAFSFIKPNLTEWRLAVGHGGKVQDIEELVEISRRNFSNTEWVCVSSFQGGAVMIGKNEVYFGKLPPLKIRSTVGAGDSMVAGWVSGQMEGLLPENSFRRALACAGATLSTRGTELAHLQDVRRLEKKCKIIQVKIPVPAQAAKK